MTYIAKILNEVKSVTPAVGFNVCSFDDYEQVGNRLTVIKYFGKRVDAEQFIIDNKYDEKNTFIYGNEQKL